MGEPEVANRQTLGVQSQRKEALTYSTESDTATENKELCQGGTDIGLVFGRRGNGVHTTHIVRICAADDSWETCQSGPQ